MRNLTAHLKLVSFLLIFQILGCGINSNETFTTTEIKSNQFNEVLFIKTQNWGLTGDNQITIISPTNDIDFDKKETEDYYIFNGLEPFLYRQSNDSLILYLRTKVKTPKNFKTKWKIIQNIADNPELMNLHQDKRFKAP
jgi:hypothetical protein